ncbi:hypothetical protein [Paenibacillus sacheonensis]|uniref:Uncharacterized protein n=1 Tax=Paenibacillus sacheonensis TaxID=742054 RepID=A0A7X5BYD6_9BACL|nr:hypothetical protein [Paenibacillus sacheonensis]MBM7564797.1 hypothetical protein [Paenibacillus sacheonensis]NBC69346.1 hypothetical protein [Paenibacillus sacheonensis]
MLAFKPIQWLGFAAALASIALWIPLAWTDPYFEGMNKLSHPSLSFAMLVLPACLFFYGLLRARVILLVIAFLWSFPFNLALLFSSSIYALIGACGCIYLLCILLLRLNKIRY